MHRSFFALAAFAVIAGAAAVIPACTDQGEGDRCDEKALNGGNDDCQSGLVCKHVPSFTSATICCPENPSQATTVVCSAASGIDSGPAPDTGADDDASPATDAGDASTDTGADTSTDANADAGTDANADTSTPDANADPGADAADLDAPADG